MKQKFNLVVKFVLSVCAGYLAASIDRRKVACLLTDRADFVGAVGDALEELNFKIRFPKRFDLRKCDAVLDMHWKKASNFAGVHKSTIVNSIKGVGLKIGDKDLLLKALPESADYHPQTWLLGPDSVRFSPQSNKLYVTKQLKSWSGRGVEVTKHPRRPRKGELIVQEYVSNTALHLNKFKFDLRVWIVLLRGNKAFLFKDAFVRVASKVFDLNSTDRCAHVTSSNVQKQCAGSVASNPVKMSQLKNHSKMLGAIYDLATKLLRDVDLFSEQQLGKGFQILSLDVVFSKDLSKIWLLEINVNGYMGNGMVKTGMLIKSLELGLLGLNSNAFLEIQLVEDEL